MPRTQWEYTTLYLDRDLFVQDREKLLNTMGGMGWELVQIIPDSSVRPAEVGGVMTQIHQDVAYFKREISNP